MTKVFISAGEASGDLHAAALTRAILQRDPTAHDRTFSFRRIMNTA